MTERINCQDCRFWSFDMDMDAFCTHENANGFGTVLRVMRGNKKTANMRGQPCGPDAEFFEKGDHPWAAK